jgi:hypothetical protein
VIVKSKMLGLGAACAGLLLSLLPLLGSTAWAGETKDACVKANGDGQALRLEGKLGAARPLLVQCGDPSCPGLVRDDCAQRLDELERVQPTIVLEVKDTTGADATGTVLTIDGQLLHETWPGRALRVDPGEHELEFAAPGFAPVKRRFVLNEGEKERHERIVLERRPIEPPPPLLPPPPAATTIAPRTPDPDDARPRRSAQRTLGLVLGGVGLAGVVVGSIFGGLTFSAANGQNADCGAGPWCKDRSLALADHSRAITDGAVSTASFIAGGAILAGGAAFFLTSPRGKARPATGFRLAPSVGPGGGGVSLGGEF